MHERGKSLMLVLQQVKISDMKMVSCKLFACNKVFSVEIDQHTINVCHARSRVTIIANSTIKY